MDEEGSDMIMVGLKAHAFNETDALKAVETFSRLLVGLALDGLHVSMEVTLVSYEEQLEDIELEGDGEA